MLADVDVDVDGEEDGRSEEMVFVFVAVGCCMKHVHGDTRRYGKMEMKMENVWGR